jgi:hypothetical protein
MITTINGAAFACTALAFSLVLTGCDAASTTGAAIATAPAGVVVVNAVLAVAPANFAVCAGGGFFTSGVTLVVSSAHAAVSVGDVTLRMSDGTNLGGPGVTVPQLQLAGGAPTLVLAGGSRRFLLTPALACGFAAPRTLHADIGVVDAAGTRTVIHATTALP